MILNVYAFKNLKYTESSSGGAFPTIVEMIYSQCIKEECKLAVYGAAFNEEFEVIHQRITSLHEMKKFQGSKYVQSNLLNSFMLVYNDLKSGYVVVFSGTPCQCFSLKMFLKNKNIDIENLILIDIICHGTPNPQIWKEFINWIENKEDSKITAFSFRYSQSNWKEYPVMIKFSNGKRFVNSYDARKYTELYFSNLIMRECCYNCRFANDERISDITLGDFWGIEQVIPEFPYQHGVSQILVNSDKGKKIIDKIITIADSQIFIKENYSEDYKSYQANINRPTLRLDKVDGFWKDYKNCGFEYILKKYTRYSKYRKWKHNIKRFFIEKHDIKRG